MGRKIAYFIPIRGAEFTETFRQEPCGYCQGGSDSIYKYGLPVLFRMGNGPEIPQSNAGKRKWWKLW